MTVGEQPRGMVGPLPPLGTKEAKTMMDLASFAFRLATHQLRVTHVSSRTQAQRPFNKNTPDKCKFTVSIIFKCNNRKNNREATGCKTLMSEEGLKILAENS